MKDKLTWLYNQGFVVQKSGCSATASEVKVLKKDIQVEKYIHYYKH